MSYKIPLLTLEQLRNSAQRQKRNYDKLANPRKYPIDSWVWRWYPPKAKQKLGKGWIGPYLVINQLSDITYRIPETAVSAPKVVHIDHLKPCYTDPSDLPDIRIDISLPRENPVNLNESVPNADMQTRVIDRAVEYTDIQREVASVDSPVYIRRIRRTIKPPDRLDL